MINLNRKVPRIIDLIDNFGSFAKPFLNMALADKNVKGAWKRYLAALKLSWKNEFYLALDKINEGLKLCQNDKTLYYLLLSKKLSLFLGMKDTRGDLVYVELLKKEADVPLTARKHVMSILLNYRPIREMEEEVDLRKARTWSKKYMDDHRTQVFFLLGKARGKVEIGKNSEAFSFFLKSFRIAKNIPHPLGITDALNDMAWYMRNIHPYWSCGIAKQAVYWAGWYNEEVTSVFYTFDTLFECQKIVNDFQVWESANVMLLTSRYLPHGKGRETQEHYNDKLEFCKQIIPNYRISRYENSESVRKYLRDNMRSATYAYKVSGVGKANILALLNNHVKEVKGDTLKRLIIGLRIKVYPKGSPFPIWNEYVKTRIKSAFSRSIEKLKNIGQEQRQIDFISTYMAYLNRQKSLPHLSRKGNLKKAVDLLKNIQKFEDYMSKRYETMKFVNDMVNKMYPFLQARKDLAKKFVEGMSSKAREKLIEIYAENKSHFFICENDRKIIDKFVRHYIRYQNTKWKIGLKSVSSFQFEHSQCPSLERIIQIFSLKKTPTILAYYALERKERKRFLNLLKKIQYIL